MASTLNGSEGHVACRAAGFLLPLFEEAPIAQGHERGRSEPQPHAGRIDPFFRPFKFRECSNGRFVQNAMSGRIGEFGAPFFIDENGLISKLNENRAKRIAVRDFSFGFDPVFMARIRIVAWRQTLVRKYPSVSVSSYAKNGLPGAQLALLRIVQSITLEGARRNNAKGEAAKSFLQVLNVFDPELGLDLDSAHGTSISRSPVGDNNSYLLGVDLMQTLRLSVNAKNLDAPSSRSAIEQAANIVRTGGTVAFPTETVYGLGANALDAAAVAKIFAAKQRPKWDPLIVHLADRSMLSSIATRIPDDATRLMDAFWPGPLSLLLRRSASVPDAVTAGRPLVGVRVPGHPVAHALLRAAGVPVAAPSANRFGRISPTLASHVLEDLDGRIDAILDSGETTHGLESTVVDPSVNPCVVYRPGVITLEQIHSVCPAAVMFDETTLCADAQPESLPSPGVGLRHYAPRARLILVDGEGLDRLQSFITEARTAGATEKLGLMLPGAFEYEDIESEVLVYRWGAWSNEDELAQRLYAGLRWLDAAGATVIVCPLPDAKGIGVAIRDRLRKAACK
jgi:L-threonylcarbamoyladenylate synthase